MKKAYIILAHKSPIQLKRLIDRLDDNNSTFFIHIDKKVRISDFIFETNQVKKIRYVKKREKGDWGGMGIVKATLNALKQIKESGDFDYISLLSGQDYPIKSNTYIDNYLSENYGKIFIEHFPMPAVCWLNGGMNRIKEYYIGNRLTTNRYKRKFLDYLNKLAEKRYFFSRKFPAYLIPFGGAQWWTITSYAMRYMLNFVDSHPDYLRFHNYSMLPDEMFFQTILLNSDDKQIITQITNNNLRYIDWTKATAAHPATLTIDDFDLLKQSDKLWGRKFDLLQDNKILLQIDKQLLSN